jgi:hypothetical protein
MSKLTTTSCQQVPVDIGALPDWQQEKPDAHLQAWFNENHPDDNMVYKSGYSQQCIFIRDNISRLFRKNLKKIEVVSTHTSKSIKLPVFHIVIEGVELFMRDNFYGWKVSVNSDADWDFPLELFSKPEEQINHIYCEGFAPEWVYECYATNKKRFTVEIYNDDMLFVFLFLLYLQLEKSDFYNTSI